MSRNNKYIKYRMNIHVCMHMPIYGTCERGINMYNIYTYIHICVCVQIAYIHT